MKKYIMIKMVLLVLVLFVGKSPALSPGSDIKCEVRGFDFKLSGRPGYLIEFGSFSLSEKGEVTKFYKLPQTNLFLSVLAYIPKNRLTSNDQLSMMMVLGKKKILPSLEFDEEKMAEDTIGLAQTLYPMEAFNKGGEGMLSMAFLGKKRPVGIMMRCKKEGS